MEIKSPKEKDTHSQGENQRAIALVGGQSLELERGAESDTLHIVGTDGDVSLAIEITKSGPVLRIEGANLAIQARGHLVLEAESLKLHGRSGLAISSDGDVSLKTPGLLVTEASDCHVEATLGDVTVRANDDVRLNGERVMVNC